MTPANCAEGSPAAEPGSGDVLGQKPPLARRRVMCEPSPMATNLAIDDELLNEALKVGGHRTKKATVTEALEEYIRRRRQAQIVELFGTIDFAEGLDAKKKRRRR
jgi:hypothetical protein